MNFIKINGQAQMMVDYVIGADLPHEQILQEWIANPKSFVTHTSTSKETLEGVSWEPMSEEEANQLFSESD